MGKQEQAFSNKIVRTLLDTQRSITEIKYLYLKIVESHSVKELSKAELKGLIIELATSLNGFFNDLRFKKINKFNIDDVETSIEKFIQETGKRIRKVRKHGFKLASARIHLDRIPAGESEIDRALVSSRVFEEQALEKDKLDYLNAIKSFLVEATGGAEKAKRKTKSGATTTEQELLSLKIRNFIETFAGYKANNLDILYKVRSKVERALQSQTKTNVSVGSQSAPAVLNHNELYLQSHDNRNYSISFRDPNIAFLLEILLVQEIEGKPPVYRGEISGWAESGASRVNFFLKDKQAAPTIELKGPIQAGAAANFLKKTEIETIYTRIRQACEEKAGEMDRLQQKVEREMKQKVSEALDEAL
jgi:hypothetical protein